MKDQIIINHNGEVAIAVPLYRSVEVNELENLSGYSIQLFKDDPVAFAVDMGQGSLQLINAEFLNARVEFLGDL